MSGGAHHDGEAAFRAIVSTRFVPRRSSRRKKEGANLARTACRAPLLQEGSPSMCSTRAPLLVRTLRRAIALYHRKHGRLNRFHGHPGHHLLDVAHTRGPLPRPSTLSTSATKQMPRRRHLHNALSPSLFARAPQKFSTDFSTALIQPLSLMIDRKWITAIFLIKEFPHLACCPV